MSDTARIARAYLVAARAHAGQTRKGAAAQPYINHPCEVADLVAATGADADTVIAAILHDVVEDSDATLDDLREAFGPKVAQLVAVLTNPPEWDDLPRSEMKLRQADHIADAAAEAKLIKIADQASNLRDIAHDPPDWPATRAVEYIEGAARVVGACRGTNGELEAAFDAALSLAREKVGTWT